MSYRLPELPSESEDLRRLREFLGDLEAILQAVVDHPERIIPGRLHQPLKLAWPRVEEHFQTLHNGLLPDEDGQPKAEIRADLKTVGLTGESLAFELAVFNAARDRLIDHAPRLFASRGHPYVTTTWIGPKGEIAARTDIGPGWWPWRTRKEGKGSGRWRKLRGFLKLCLKSGDTILGSVGKLAGLGLPAEGIKQCKEGVEGAVAWTKGIAESRWE